MKKIFTNTKLLIISAVLSALCLAVMDIFLFPEVKAQAGNIAAFDLQSVGYSKLIGLAFLHNITDLGKSYYYAAIGVDFVFMFAYTFLFIGLFMRLNKIGAKLVFLPVALFAVDVAEDVMSIIMLKSGQFINAASTVSAVKNVLTYLCALALLVLFIMWIVKRKKKK